ncbi:oligosaccharide flippase family protein [Terrimonas pollutisoli]|uniref:oligosaccharide flippase family protein n=1 Tax=Terrimonas pollutisoli TaxID=3034147 RepID=UPI0023ED7834|nr:oligosaccharide flippase family protein [Terrimonas sp. H1YJ31]
MPTGNSNKLFYNFFSLGTVQAISSLIQLMVIPYVIRKIGVDSFGVVAVAQVVMFYLAVLVDYGFNQSAVRDIAIYKDDPKQVSAIFFRVLFSKLILCVIAFILLLLLVLFVPVFREHFVLYGMAFLFVAGQSLLLSWFFQGLEKMHLVAAAILTGRVLFVILVFIFIKNKNDDILYLLFWGIGNIITGIISLVIAVSVFNLTFVRPSRQDITAELYEGWPIAFSHLSNSACHYSNTFILTFFASDLVVGYYSIAERILFAIKQVFVVFSQSVYPRVCLLLQKGKEFVFVFFRQVYLKFFVLVVLGCFLLFIFSAPILYFFMGNENVHSVFFLRMFSIVAIMICLNIPATLLLLAANQKKNYFRLYTSAAAINILLNITLASRFEARGTVLVVFFTEFLITMGLNLIVYRQYMKDNKQVGEQPVDVNY